MALETVRILVQDDQVVPQPVDDVVVRVYDATGVTLLTSGISGAVIPGVVEVTLNGGATPVVYQLRFYITGGAIVSPQRIEVYSPASLSSTGANNFEVTASLFQLPQAVDPQLCRVSGYVRSPDGRPRKGVDMHFIAEFSPLLTANAVVLGELVAVRSDATGYASVDLYRNGIYSAVVESQENIAREVVVPDRASLSLGDLLFPVVASVSYGVGSVVLPPAATFDLTPTVQASNFQVLTGPAGDDVTYAVDDPTVASVTVLSDRITIHGLQSGTTTLRATRTDQTIVRAGDTGIQGGDLSIHVS